MAATRASERTLRPTHTHTLSAVEREPGLAAAQLQAPRRSTDQICGSTLPSGPNILKPEAGFLVPRRHSAAALPSPLRLHLLPDPSPRASDTPAHQSAGLQPRRRDWSSCAYQQRGAGLIARGAHRVYAGPAPGNSAPAQPKVIRFGIQKRGRELRQGEASRRRERRGRGLKGAKLNSAPHHPLLSHCIQSPAPFLAPYLQKTDYLKLENEGGKKKITSPI